MRSLVLACAVAGVFTGAPASVVGQDLFLAPEAGWSELRAGAVGVRAGVGLFAGLEAVAQGLVFFPDDEALQGPGAAVSRSAWQANANVLYHFDRKRTIAPYLGVGMRYARSDLSVVVDGLRVKGRNSGWEPNVIMGAHFTKLPRQPFIEWKNSNGLWVLTGGFRWGFGGGER